MNRDKAKTTIAKLLNMTRERGASPDEARTAAEKTVELMLEFNISLPEIAPEALPDGERSFSLLDLIAQHGGVKVDYRTRGTIRKGRPLYFLADRAFMVPAAEIERLIAENSIEPDGDDRWRATPKALAATILLHYAGGRDCG